MRIGGAVALALPEADARTVFLTMTPLERQLYDKAVARTAFKPEWMTAGVKAAYLEMQIGVRYAAAPPLFADWNPHLHLRLRLHLPLSNWPCLTPWRRRRAAASNGYTKWSARSKEHPIRSHLRIGGAFTQAEVESICNFEDFEPVKNWRKEWSVAEAKFGEMIDQPYAVKDHREYIADPDKCTKLSALRADLRALRLHDRSMHAVVFTHVAVTHLAVVEMLRADAFHVYEFSGATKVTERHQSIRDFQASGQAKSGQAKVFVITMKTGAVGVTLTAATRVYLMEPVRAERLQPGCCSCPLATVSPHFRTSLLTARLDGTEFRPSDGGAGRRADPPAGAGQGRMPHEDSNTD